MSDAVVGFGGVVLGAIIAAVVALIVADRQSRALTALTRQMAAEARAEHAAGRVRDWHLAALRQLRVVVTRNLDWYELLASGDEQRAAAIDRRSWGAGADLGFRRADLALLGSSGLVNRYRAFQAHAAERLGGHAGWDLHDLAAIEALRQSVIEALDRQELRVIRDEEPERAVWEFEDDAILAAVEESREVRRPATGAVSRDHRPG